MKTFCDFRFEIMDVDKLSSAFRYYQILRLSRQIITSFKHRSVGVLLVYNYTGVPFT